MSDPDGIITSRAALDVIRERFRQTAEEGYSPEHDDGHDEGEFAYAGAAYARHAADLQNPREAEALAGPVGKLPPPAWPWEAKDWKPKSIREDLVRAAALIIAEIERFDRADEADPMRVFGRVDFEKDGLP